MTLGEKIKAARKAKKMTQSRLTKDKITRNMLSRIESGTANPSLDTIRYLANELSIPVSYLLSDNDDLLFYEKAEKLDAIYSAYSAKEYKHCISKINSLSSLDNELAFILASSHFELAKISIADGALVTAARHLDMALENSEKTLLDTSVIEAVIPMYRAIAQNVQSPLLEFDPEIYKDKILSSFDFELYKFLTQDYEYDYRDKFIRNHAKAKLLIKERRYKEAIPLLTEAAELSSEARYNAFIMFGIYADLENCYKQLYDFENAYRYSSKRMSMLEGFKS